MPQPHRYDAPDLPSLIEEAFTHYEELSQLLHKIQQRTGIPGLHTNSNSDDSTPGVLERIQAMYDNGEQSLAAFMAMDDGK